jgi:hypothetical protein
MRPKTEDKTCVPHVLAFFPSSSSPTMSTLKVRKDCRYSAEELQKIIPFKQDFVSSTIQERMSILKKDILPAIFNYWEEIGKVYDSEESKALTKVNSHYNNNLMIQNE